MLGHELFEQRADFVPPQIYHSAVGLWTRLIWRTGSTHPSTWCCPTSPDLGSGSSSVPSGSKPSTRWVPLSKGSAQHHCLELQQTLGVSVLGCPVSVPDPWLIIDALHAALEESGMRSALRHWRTTDGAIPSFPPVRTGNSRARAPLRPPTRRVRVPGVGRSALADRRLGHALRRQEPARRLGVERPAEVVALGQDAAQRAQAVLLRRCLHALGDRPVAQGAGQLTRAAAMLRESSPDPNVWTKDRSILTMSIGRRSRSEKVE